MLHRLRVSLNIQRPLSLWPRRSKPRFQADFDPFRYTEGRWLDRDQVRREARTLHFDFDALLDVAVKCCPGARRVVKCEKKEGGFNRVFIVHLDNDETVVARLPTRLAGPPSLTVSSEVATLRYVKQYTNIPVPKVLAWSAERDNHVGSEYMIQEAIRGVLLKDVWNSMSALDRLSCIESIGNHCTELSLLRFPVFGSLYFTASAPSDAVQLDDHFCVGSMTAPQHWCCNVDNTDCLNAPKGLQGPWLSLDNYFKDLIESSKTTLSTADAAEPSQHLGLLDTLEDTIGALITNAMVKNAGAPTLFHPDLHSRNIFVDPTDNTKVTGIIDWQSAAVEPAFVFASCVPDFAEEFPNSEDAKNVTEEEQAANAKLRSTVDLCVKMWAVTQQGFENIRPASRLHPALLKLLSAPSQGFADRAPALIWLLNDLATKWHELGIPGESLHKPVENGRIIDLLDEIDATSRLKEHLTQLLGCDYDGWVPSDRWDEILPRYQLEYSRFVESVVESEECKTEGDRVKAIEKANRLWPYDQR